MLLTWQGVRFEGIKKGRTSPLLLGCERLDGDQIFRGSFVVKAVGLPEVATFTLAQECAGSVLAAAAGVIVPEVALIELPPEFVTATSGDLEQFGLQIEAGMAVGATYLQGLAPMNRNPTLRDDEIEAAARIYAVDLALQNPDRRTDNPNCGYHRKMITAYDFEAAFSFRMLIGAKPDACDVTTFGIHNRHLFFAALRGKPIQWRPICRAICSLNGALLEPIRQQAPQTWQPILDSISEHLTMLTGRADDLEAQIRRSLS
jgi:HipA-like protein